MSSGLSSRTSGRVAHVQASPNRRGEPRHDPIQATKFGYVRCPTCAEYWTGLKWGDACPDCGTVRLADGNWFPWGDG
jgi:hypothetical protein